MLHADGFISSNIYSDRSYVECTVVPSTG